jgi:death on curing protein
MSQWTWLEEPVVWAIHEAQLAEHGGSAGVRDAGLLASALARPLNLAAYGEADAAALAAAYGFGVARNHPFIDGNKRTAFVCCELFLTLNGQLLVADDALCVSTMLALAAGELPEADFAAWLRTHSAPA